MMNGIESSVQAAYPSLVFQIDELVVTEPEMLGLRLLFLSGFAGLGPHPPEAGDTGLDTMGTTGAPAPDRYP